MNSRDSMSAGLDMSWRPLYAAGSVCALIYAVMCLVPLILVFAAPPVPATGAEVLDYIAANRIVYLTQLISFVGLSVPALVVFLALSVSLKGANKSLAAIGGLIGIGSEIMALSLNGSPQSLHGALVHLSGQYIAAGTDARRLALTTAAEGFIASANGLNFVGFLTALGILLLSVITRKGVYGKFVFFVGIAAGAVGMVFEPLRPLMGNSYTIYGTLLLAWFIGVGLKLFRESRA